MEVFLNILAFCFVGIVVCFCLLFIFKKSLFNKIDAGLERGIGFLFGNLVISLGVIVILGGLLIVGFQLYLGLFQGQWIRIPLEDLAKAGIAEHISAFLAWLNAKLALYKTIPYIFHKIPLSIFLLLVGLFIAFLGFSLARENSWQETPPKKVDELKEAPPLPEPLGEASPLRATQPSDEGE
jgi:hypothetical protein